MIGLGNGDNGRLSMQFRLDAFIHEVTNVPVKVNPRLACPLSTPGNCTTPGTGLQFSVAVQAVCAINGVT
jgi:hypothetical protein